MLNELHPGRVGYQGKDSMRDKAKRMFGSSMSMDMNMPRSRSEKSKEKPRLYARGGEVAPEKSEPKMKRGGHHSHHMHHLMHGGEVPNYHDPDSGAPHMKRGGHHKRPAHPKMHEHHKAHKGPRTPKLNIESARGMEHMRRGGHTKKHYNDGGMVGMMGSNPDTWSPTVAAKRGGKIAKKRCFNDGGMVGHEMHHDAVGLKRGGKAHRKHRYADGGMIEGQDWQSVAPGDTLSDAQVTARNSAYNANADAAINKARELGAQRGSGMRREREAGPQGGSRMQQALGLAKQYAPRAREAINRYAPRIGRGLDQAYGMAKHYAPQAQEMIGKFSPGMAERFGQLRNAVGLKKGGKAHHKHHEHHGHHKHHDEHYAMGGVGKVRHGEATKGGRPTHRRVVKGR